MASPRLQTRPRAERRQDTSDADVCPAYGRLRDELALTNQSLDAQRPEILDDTADVIRAAHDVLRGNVSATRGVRADDYRRGQLIGRHPLTLPDLVQLAHDAPEAIIAALHVLASMVAHKLEPTESRPARGIVSETADVVQAVGDLMEAVAFAAEDGQITNEEHSDIRTKYDHARYQFAEYVSASAKVKTSNLNAARLYLYAGHQYDSYSSYHTGGAAHQAARADDPQQDPGRDSPAHRSAERNDGAMKDDEPKELESFRSSTCAPRGFAPCGHSLVKSPAGAVVAVCELPDVDVPPPDCLRRRRRRRTDDDE